MSTQKHSKSIDISKFTKRLRMARIASGLTQEELAKAVGVSRATVNTWENGRGSTPPAPTFGALASLFKVPAGWLYGSEELSSADQSRLAAGLAGESEAPRVQAAWKRSDVAPARMNVEAGKMQLILDLHPLGDGNYQVVGRMTLGI
jgi:transcriptional regulator with XRE-family HTH domain